MKCIMLILASLFFLEQRGFCSVNNMFNTIKDTEENYTHRTDQLDEFVRYTFNKFSCLQVNSDQSSFADHFFELLHQCFSVPPMLHGSWTFDMNCEGFVIITSSPHNIVPTIVKFPLYNEHRFLAFTTRFSLAALNQNVNLFGDSDIIVISATNFTSAVRLGQPKRDEFEVVNNFTEPWVVDKFIRDFAGRKIKALTYNCSIFSQIGPLNEDGSATFAWMFEIFDKMVVPRTFAEPKKSFYIRWKAFQTLTSGYIKGAEIEVFNEIVETLNLTIEWHVRKDLDVESIFFNTKKWYMKPVIEQGKPTSVDVAFCGLTLSYKKMLSLLEMSEPLVLLCFKFLVPRPKLIQTEWNSIFQVFPIMLWGIIGIVMLLAAMVLQRVTTMTQKFVYTSRIHRYTKLGGSVLQLLSILVLADVPKSVKSQGASRHILTSWSIWAMVITTVFSSGLVSHLTTQRYKEKVDTIEALLRYKFNWGFQYTPDFSELLDTKGNVQHARLRIRAKYFDDRDEFTRQIKGGHYFLWGVQVLRWFFLPEEHLSDYILDGFEVADHCFIEYYLGFAFREGSVFTPAFNKYISTYKETGLMKKMFATKFHIYARKRRYSRNVLKVSTTKISKGKLTLKHLTGIIEVWAVGMGIALIVFVLEVLQKFRI